MKKLWASIIIIFSILLVSITNVQAVSSIKANITSETEKVNCNEEVIVTLKFEQYTDIDQGINAYKAKLEYNNAVFDPVKESDLIGLNDWEEVKYNENNGEFIAIKKAGSKLPEEVMQITLRVKSDAKPGKEDITVKDLVYSEGKEDVFTEDASKSIEVIKDASEIPNETDTPETPTSPETPSDSDKPADPSGSGTSEQDPNVKPGRIPNTGSSFTGWFVLLGIEIAMAVAILSYIKYRKVKKEEQRISKKAQMFMTILCVVVLSSQLIGTTYAVIAKFIQKGDVDLNNQIDIQDIRMLEEHLIGLKYLTEEQQLENAEISGDGQITVTDLTLLVRKVEKATDYQVTIEDLKVNQYYPAKNQEIIFSFSAQVNPYAYIQAVTIDQKEYSLQEGTLIKGEENNTYRVKLNSGEKAGTKKYNLTKVRLNTGKEVKVKNSIVVNVLKQEPQILNYKVVEKDRKATISFDLVDADNSISKAQVVISKLKENQTEEVVKQKEIAKGSQTIEIETEASTKYQVKIVAQYQLAPGTEKEQEYQKELTQIKTFETDIEYNFTISNITTAKDGNETTTFFTREPIQLVFDSTNASNYEPENIKVNGKVYSVIKKGSKYFATIDGIAEIGEKTITISAVTLSNGKEFILEKDNTIQISVTKRAPKVTELSFNENVMDKSIQISFQLEDVDSTIQSAQVILYDGEGNVIIGSPVEITAEELAKGIIQKSLPTSRTDKYTVKIVVTYQVTEGTTVENAILFEREIEPAIYVDITTATLSKTAFEKGEDLDITYKIETNSQQEISKIRVGGVSYIAHKVAANEYRVTLPVGNEAKLLSIETTEMLLKDETSVPVRNTQQVDVLKDIPTIENIKQQDDINANKITLEFKVVDPDEAIQKEEGKKLVQVELIKSDQDEPIQLEVAVDENGEARAVLEGLEAGKDYTANLVATYSRYHSNSEDLQETQTIATTNVSVVLFQIKDVKTNKTAFEKDEKVEIGYQIETNRDAKIVEIQVNGATYEATHTSDGYYTITVPVGNTAQILELKTTQMQLQDGTEIIVDHEQSVEVLKDIPRIENIRQEDAASSHSVTVTFQVIDPDGALVKAEGTEAVSVQIAKSADESAVIYPKEITIDESGNGKIVLEGLEEETMYVAKFMATYNRYKNSPEQLQENQVIGTDWIEWVPNYELQVSNLKTANAEGETTTFEKGEPIVLSFESTNATEFKPEKVKINGKEYEVEEKDSQYVVTIDGLSEPGEKTLTMEAIILSNGKEFALEQDHTITIVINKTKPAVTNFATQESVADHNLKVTFHVEDEDKAIQTARIELLDGEGNRLGLPVEITAEELANGTIEKFLPTSKTDKYTVKVIATYKLSEGNMVENSTIWEQGVEAQIFANIVEVTLGKDYVDKGEKVDITYKIDTNSHERMARVSINNHTYEVTRNEDGSYTASVPAGEEAKVLSLITTRLFFSDGVEITVNNEVRVDVRKEEPRLEQISQASHLDPSIVAVTFKVIDPDGALIQTNENPLVKVQVAKASKPDEMIQTVNASVEENGDARVEIENLEMDTEYLTQYVVSYNRYHNAAEKQETNKVIATKVVERIGQNVIRVVDVRTCNEDGATKYFKKNEDLILEVECLNTTESQVRYLFFNLDGVDRAEGITRVGNTNAYRLTLSNALTTLGVKNIKVIAVGISYNNRISVSKELKIEVLKDKPTVANFGYSESETNPDEVLVNFTFQDPDKAIQSATVIVTDDKQQEVKRQPSAQIQLELVL